MIGKTPDNSQTAIRPGSSGVFVAKGQSLPAMVLPEEFAKIINHTVPAPTVVHYAHLLHPSNHARCSHASEDAGP